MNPLAHQNVLQNLGPLTGLVGVWEGDKGDDIAPSDDRGTENNKFRERMTFELIKPVDNHEQHLFGLRYSTVAWRIGETEPFHEEVGYWLRDPQARQLMKTFLIPRGVSVIAGCTVDPNARSFQLVAQCGSLTYGICSNKFLDQEFKTIRFTVKVTIQDDTTFSYEEDSQLQIKGQLGVFHHKNSNTLKKVK